MSSRGWSLKNNFNMRHRRSIRLKGYDYSQEGAYFVTICTQNRECIFEEFPQLRDIIKKQWIMIPIRYEKIVLDEYVIMPNHIHGIIVITEIASDATATTGGKAMKQRAGENRAPARDAPTGALSLASNRKTIGDIVGAFKSLSSTEWLRAIRAENLHAQGKFWQRNYYEHIIRNENELNRIREYIINNPAQWAEDEYNPKNVKQHITANIL